MTGVNAKCSLEPGGGKRTAESNSRPWLARLPKSWWLLNDIGANQWIVMDSSQQKPKTINWEYRFADKSGTVLRLTDPECSPLLATAQLCSFHVREGHLATCASAMRQAQCASNLCMLVGWMRLNDIFRFSQLTKPDSEKYQQDCVYGKAGLLNGVERLDRYVQHIRQNGLQFPSKRDGRYTILDQAAIGESIGYDSFQNENVLLYRLNLIAKEEGYYLCSNQRRMLDAGEPQKEIRTQDTIRGLLMPWKHLWDLRTELEDTIQFDPFDGVPVRQIAKQITKEAGVDEDSCTDIIPELQAAFLIDRALRWVVNYSEDLFVLRDHYESLCDEFGVDQRTTYQQSLLRTRMNSFLRSYNPIGFEPGSASYPAQPWPLAAEFKLMEPSDHRVCLLPPAVNKYLMVACAIVICAFTSRRHEEVLKIYDDSPAEGDPRKPAIETDEEGDWLWCWIEKTVRGWDRTPCPRVVRHAVDLLHRLSESARRLTGSRELFQCKVIGSTEVFRMTNFNLALKEFVDFVEVPPLEDGTRWHFTPQQFRKFFGILYMFGYEHGNLSALSHHMRHGDLQMTEDYVLRRSNETMLSTMRKHHATELLIDISTGKRNAAGKGGETLSELLGRLMKTALKHVEIIPANYKPAAARRVAERVMQKLELAMIPFKWGYCSAFKKLGGDGEWACVEGQGKADGPDLTKATPEKCSGCGHFYTDEHFRFWWESMADLYEDALRNPNLPDVFRAHTERLAEMFRHGVARFFREGESP